MIQVNNVFKEYPGGIKALDGVSFEIQKGDICGYIGANGAGKSTTIKILTGLLEFDKGEVTVAGINVKDNPVELKKLIGYVPESGNMFNSLTGREFLSFIGTVRNMDESKLSHRIESFAGIFEYKDLLDSPLSIFSKGNKQKVLITSALLHDPDVIFLDEPLNGLDANTIFTFRDMIKDLSGRGKTIFYCSHLLDVIEKISTRILLIDKGRIVLDKNTVELKDSKDYTNLENLFKSLEPESKRKKFSYEEIFG
jgi:ABC-2 type transport system ATP-binding protein